VATIPDETKELILAQTDIVDLINPHVPLKRVGSQFRGLCPFHNEKSPSFYVTPSMQRFKCFGCGEGGDAISFLMKYRNIPYPEAVAELAKRAGVTIIEEAYDPEAEKARRRRSRLLELHNKAARYIHHLLLTSPDAAHARAYLKSRGYGKEIQGFSGRELCGTGIASLKDESNPRAGLYLRFRDRLMFPIHNDYGDIIAFSGRQLVEDKNSGKYINSPETPLFKKSKVFFALDRAKKAMGKEKFALLCEGQIDVIACHEAGFENAVAGLGTALTHEHSRLLKRYTDAVVLCYDSDNAGHLAIGKAFTELAAAGLEVSVAPLPEKEDPDSLIKSQGTESFRKLITNASGFFDYQIDFAQRNIDLSQPLKKTQLANNLAIYIKKIGDPVAKDTIINHCATRLQIGIPEFQAAIANVREERQYKSQKDQEPEKISARSYDPSVLQLCQLGLQSIEVQDWLCDQTESLLEIVASLPGQETLIKLLGQRPTPSQPASINRFLGSLPEADSLTVASALEDTLPENPVDYATRALNFLARLNETNRLRDMLHGNGESS